MGGAHAFVPGSLWAGSNKGETGRHLPLSLLALVLSLLLCAVVCVLSLLMFVVVRLLSR